MRPTASVGLPPLPRVLLASLQACFSSGPSHLLGTFPPAHASSWVLCSPLPPPNVMSLPSLPSLSHWVLSGNRRHLPTPAPTPTHISVPSFFVLLAPSSPRTSPCRTPLAYCVPVTLAFRSLPQRARVSPAQGLFTVRSFAQRPLPLDLRTARPPGPVNVPASGLPCPPSSEQRHMVASHCLVSLFIN